MRRLHFLMAAVCLAGLVMANDALAQPLFKIVRDTTHTNSCDAYIEYWLAQTVIPAPGDIDDDYYIGVDAASAGVAGADADAVWTGMASIGSANQYGGQAMSLAGISQYQSSPEQILAFNRLNNREMNCYDYNGVIERTDVESEETTCWIEGTIAVDWFSMIGTGNINRTFTASVSAGDVSLWVNLRNDGDLEYIGIEDNEMYMGVVSKNFAEDSFEFGFSGMVSLGTHIHIDVAESVSINDDGTDNFLEDDTEFEINLEIQ